MATSSKSSKLSLCIAVFTLAAGVTYICNVRKSDTTDKGEPQLSQSDTQRPIQPKVDLDSLEPAAREIAEQVPLARGILDDWRTKNFEKAPRFLHIVYWTPRDKPAAAGYQQRLDDIFADIQEFYRLQMESLGFGSDKTIGLDRDQNGALKIHYVTGQKNYDQYAVGSGHEIRKECLNTLRKAGVDAANETLVIFCNMSVWDPEKRHISQNSPYYASGSNTNGTAWQVDSPILKLEDLTNNGDHVFDRQYGRITLGKYNTIFIGGIVHELGHAFGLPHNLERPDQAEEFGVALMGSGNRAYKDELRGDGKGAFITLAHGLKLASHPMFSGYTARMHEDPKTELEGLKFESEGKGFAVSGKVTGAIPPYAVIAYMNPEGNKDYNATTATCIPDENGNFRVLCNALEAGKDATLSLVFLHANGRASSFHGLGWNYTYPYSVDKAGNADISETQKRLEIAPFVEALKAGEIDPFQKLKKPSEETLTLAMHLMASGQHERPLAKPSLIDSSKKSAVLTSCKFESIKVGYGAPLFNRSTAPDLLLSSAGVCYNTGLFAHAQSRAVYDLGGKWSKLNGVCGLIDGGRGQVVFILVADGKEIYKSPVTKVEKSHAIDVDVTGVQKLELITTDGGDGIRSDWSAWLDMKLSR